jgi:polygalacturonase
MKTYDVDSFGALADGLTLATKAIQRAIDACNENGGGQVVIGSGEYLTGSIEIKTGDDCLILRAIDGVFAKAKPCENVTITNCVLDSWCQGIRVGCPADGTIRNAVFSDIVIRSSNNGILLEHPKRHLLPGSTGSADIHDLRFSGMVIQSDGSPIRVNVEEGIALKRISELSFSDIQMRSILPCRIEGSSNTVIRNVGFSNIRIDTSGNDAVVFRSCEGIRLDNVELANHPIE